MSAAGLLATWFGAGLLRPAPGTWGSLAALPLAWVLASLGGPVLLAAAAIGLLGVGCWAAGAYAREIGMDDPRTVVIDEVVGQWLALLAVPPDLLLYAIGFLLFRATDILKPWPASLIDRRVHGGPGIMLDDAVAGLYAGLILYAIAVGFSL